MTKEMIISSTSHETRVAILEDDQVVEVFIEREQSRGVVVPDSFTHGSSAQRVRWFRRGIESGDVQQCNTFEARQL